MWVRGGSRRSELPIGAPGTDSATAGRATLGRRRGPQAIVTSGSKKTSWIAWMSAAPSSIGPLERLAADDQALAAGALVDHRGADGLGQVVVALSTRRRS